MLRRLSLLLTAALVGLLLFLVIAEKVALSRISSTRIEPVRAAFVADWKTHLPAVEAALEAAQPWNASLAPLPRDAWCALPWTGPAAALGPLQHACTTDAEGPAPDWVDGFHAADGWADFLSQPGWVAGALPTLEPDKLDAQLGEALAPSELVDLGRALVNAPTLSTQLAGLQLLERAGTPDRDALKLARAAAALAFHPWTPPEVRARLLPKLPPASRCAALDEAGRIARWGAPIAEHYDGWLTEVTAWAPDACPRIAWAPPTDDGWKRALVETTLVEPGSTTEGLIHVVARTDAAARAAAVDALLAVTLLKPFP